MKRASVAILCSNGRALTVFNEKVRARNFPGGKAEEGETPAQTIEREITEELGLSDLTYVPLGTYDVDGWMCDLFLADIGDRLPQILEPDKVHSPFWLTYDDMVFQGVVAETHIFERYGSQILEFLAKTKT